MLQKQKTAAAFVAHIKNRRPDLEVFTYVGSRHLQDPHFIGKDGRPSEVDVVAGWEKAGGSFGDYLATQIAGNWKAWKHDRARLGKIDGLNIYEKINPDDHRLNGMFRHNAREGLYHDAARSQKRSDLLSTPHAALFGFFGEGWIGLSSKVNFWYDKNWTAPDFNPLGPYAAASFALAQGLRDRQTISAGSWTVKYFGTEVAMRKFARAFRSLPPVEMKDVPSGADTARVRWIVYKGKRYVSAVSRIPFAQALAIDGRKITLEPFELASFTDDGKAAPSVVGNPPADYVRWVSGRIAEYKKLCTEVRALNPRAVPPAYAKVAQKAEAFLKAGKPYAAEIEAAYGLLEEMRIRKRILDGPKLSAPRVAKGPKPSDNLDAWPKGASDIRADGAENLVGHVYFPTSWTGPSDLSMRVRLAHDGKRLYIGIEVRDNVAHAKDSVTIYLSRNGYLDWISKEKKYDGQYTIKRSSSAGESEKYGPFSFTCREIDGGYIVTGSAPLDKLGVKPGGSIGMLFFASDIDNDGNHPAKHRWALKQAMMVPNEPLFPYWNDARTCGKVVVER